MRRLVFAVLLVGYAALFVRVPSLHRGAEAFEPLDARGRQVETAIEQRRFESALPVARELAAEHGTDPVIAFWLAEIYRGLGQHADETRAWEHLFDLTGSADFVCPSLPDAYARAGAQAESLRAYERCASAAPDDPERWMDVAAAYQAAGRSQDAAKAYEHSRALDPSNPRLPSLSAEDVDPGNDRGSDR